MQGWRTLALNVGAGVLSVLAAANWPDLLTTVPWAPPFVLAALNFAMRFVTTTAVGVKA